MKKFLIQSREDIASLHEIFTANDIPLQLSHLFDENGEEIGISLKVGGEIYFWCVEEEANV